MDDLDSKALEALEREVHVPDPLLADYRSQVELMVSRLASLERGLYAEPLLPRTFNPYDLLAMVGKAERASDEEKKRHREAIAEAHARLGAVLGEG